MVRLVTASPFVSAIEQKKSGRGKRQKGGSFQTVSSLHRVRSLRHFLTDLPGLIFIIMFRCYFVFPRRRLLQRLLKRQIEIF